MYCPSTPLQTGGSLDAELSENGIQTSFSKITESVRTQYTLGYYSHSPAISGKHHSIDVHVEGIPGWMSQPRKATTPQWPT